MLNNYSEVILIIKIRKVAGSRYESSETHKSLGVT